MKSISKFFTDAFDRYKYIMLAVISGLVIVPDQITKAVILAHVSFQTRNIVVIPGLFNITHVRNPGGAFGVFAERGTPFRNAVFLILTSVAVFLILFFYKKTPKSQPLLLTGFALIFGGAVGNLIDRFRFGWVIDFVDLHIRGWHWPAFNIADFAITAGILIFVYYLLFKSDDMF